MERLVDRFAYSLRLVNTHDAIDDILRTTFLKVVVDLLPVRGNPAGDDMDVVVIGIVVNWYWNALETASPTR